MPPQDISSVTVRTTSCLINVSVFTQSFLSIYKLHYNFFHNKKRENLDLIMFPSSYSSISILIFNKSPSESCYTISDSFPPHSLELTPIKQVSSYHLFTKPVLCQGLRDSHIVTANGKLRVLILPTLPTSFDTTEHFFLLETLFTLDSQDTQFPWFSSYIPGHSCSVFFIDSMLFIINSCVSQGSMLSWLLLSSTTPLPW